MRIQTILRACNMLCFFIGGDNMTCIKEMSKELNTKIVNAMERIEQLVRMTDGKCYFFWWERQYSGIGVNKNVPRYIYDKTL